MTRLLELAWTERLGLASATAAHLGLVVEALLLAVALGRAARHPGDAVGVPGEGRRGPRQHPPDGPEPGVARLPAHRLRRPDRRSPREGGAGHLRAAADHQEHDPRPAEHRSGRLRGRARDGHDRLATPPDRRAPAGRADHPGRGPRGHGRLGRHGDHRRLHRLGESRALYLPGHLLVRPVPDPPRRGPGGAPGPGLRRRPRGDRAIARPDPSPPLATSRLARDPGRRDVAGDRGLGGPGRASGGIPVPDDPDRVEGRERDDPAGRDARRAGAHADRAGGGPPLEPGRDARLLQRTPAGRARRLRRVHRHRLDGHPQAASPERSPPGPRAGPLRTRRGGRALPRPARLREHLRDPDAARPGRAPRDPQDLRPPRTTSRPSGRAAARSS